MTFKEFLKEKGVSEDDFSKKTPGELAQLHSEYTSKEFTELKDAIGKAATPDEVKAVNDKLGVLEKNITDNAKNYASKDEITKLVEDLKDANAEIKTLQEKGTESKVINFHEAAKSALAEKHEELKAFMSDRKKGGYFDIEIKAPAAVTTVNITTGAVPTNYAGSIATGYSPYLRQQIFVEQYLDRGNTNLPSLPYVNESAGEGDAEMVAEGGLKPLIDADFNVEYSTAKKIAGRMKASEEALSDFGWLLGAMENTLKRKHDIARQANILNGDGTGQNLKGINTIATPFNPTMLGSLVGSMKVEGSTGEANNYDVLAAMYTAIVVQSEGTFMPNVVFVNPIDVLQMELTKDGEGRYLLPPFISEDGTTVKGVQIVSQPAITAGTFVIGDMRLLQLRDVWGYTVRIGWENDDFSRNMVTMIGESRLHLYITDNDKRGIIKGAFADVKAALNADT